MPNSPRSRLSSSSSEATVDSLWAAYTYPDKGDYNFQESAIQTGGASPNNTREHSLQPLASLQVSSIKCLTYIHVCSFALTIYFDLT